MKKSLSFVLLASVLLSIAFVLRPDLGEQSAPSVKQPDFSEKVNLALRQTAHELLQNAGDSTATVPAMQKLADNKFLMPIHLHFNYDILPQLLQKNFETLGIQGKYEVAVSDCNSKILLLGFLTTTNSDNKNVPCVGRTHPDNCYDFTVTFPTQTAARFSPTAIAFLLGGLFVAGIGAFLYYFYGLPQKKLVFTPFMPESQDQSNLIHFGNTVFDFRNETVCIGQTVQKLTFREAKLLHLFVQHQNELLDRDNILKAVWEDEGILVGRSVDVFVSRLRKLLKEDPSVKITNVHGRGYRFET